MPRTARSLRAVASTSWADMMTAGGASATAVRNSRPSSCLRASSRTRASKRSVPSRFKAASVSSASATTYPSRRRMSDTEARTVSSSSATKMAGGVAGRVALTVMSSSVCFGSRGQLAHGRAARARGRGAVALGVGPGRGLDAEGVLGAQQLFGRLRLQRRGPQETLAQPALEAVQLGALLGQLDTFGHELESELMTEEDETLEQRG